MNFEPGDKIKVDVGSAMRSYTPAQLSSSLLRFVGVLHGQGPGSAWLDGLEPGDPVSFFGPARSLRRVEGALDWAAFVGDETTIGAAEALLGALSPGVKRFGALEVHPESVDAVAARSLGTATLPREERGAAMLRWAEAMPIPLGEGVVWLSGEASSLVPVKRALLERGLPRRMLRVKPYWSVKGKAHRKALERGALR